MRIHPYDLFVAQKIAEEIFSKGMSQKQAETFLIGYLSGYRQIILDPPPEIAELDVKHMGH